jgi:hypothetical protein
MSRVRSFYAAAIQAGRSGCVGLSGNNDQVIAKGTSLKGRAVAWLTTVFGGPGAVANRKATKAFLDAVGSDYGASARDDVYQLLRDRLREGTPLRRRHVEMGIRMASTALAAEMTKLGDEAHSTPARTKIEDLVARGALSEEGAQALLTPGTEAHKQLRKAIGRAVLKAAAQNNGQPIEVEQALIATKNAVEEAARRITAAENEALATELADLGGPERNTSARDTIKALRRLGVLSPKEAAKWIDSVDSNPENRMSLEAKIKKAVLDAAKQNGDRPLDRRAAIFATENAVLEAACQVTNTANNELARRFARLGENTHASAEIHELVQQGLLPSDAAEALLTTHRAGLEHDIEQAVGDTISREVKWNASSTKARPQTGRENSVWAILDAAPEDDLFPRALKVDEASYRAKDAIGRFMQRKAAVLEVIKDSELPPEAKEQLSLSAMTDPEAKTDEYANLAEVLPHYSAVEGLSVNEARLLDRSELSPEVGRMYRQVNLKVTEATLLDPKYRTENEEACAELGRGAINIVYRVTYRDGEVWAFKPLPKIDGSEVEKAWVAGMIGIDVHDPQIAPRNLATVAVARKLGFDVVIETRIAEHGGQVGLLMSIAPGKSASETRQTDRALFEDPVVRRELTKLQLLDALVGQVDRHGKNYFIEKTPEGKVTVTGIDLDQGFGHKVTDPNHIAPTSNFAGFHGLAYLADTFHGVLLPPVVDTEMADAFDQLTPEDLDDLLRDKLSPAEVDAAKQRLQGIKDHINGLRAQGHVIDPADWGDPFVTRLLTPENSYAARDGRPPQ